MNRSGATAVALAAGVAVTAAVGGAVLGVLAVLVHALWWGLPLGLATVVAVLVAVPRGWTRRFAVAAGWVLALTVLTFTRPEGDFLVASDTSGYVLLGAGIVVLAGGVVGLGPRRRAVRATPGEGATESGEVGPTP